jgi:IS5 family transposase
MIPNGDWPNSRVGHPAKIRAAETRKQKHDRRDAHLLLDLLGIADVNGDGRPDLVVSNECNTPTCTHGGNQWYFGMKAHVAVDSKTKIIHSVVATAANVADSTMLPDLLHGEETRVWGDQAYKGQSLVIKECAPGAQDHTHRRYRYKNGFDEQEREKNRSNRACVRRWSTCFR